MQKTQGKREDHGPVDTDKWRAVIARDHLADGHFVYAVKSTGIYCRPSCGARKPALPTAVEFFSAPEEAEAAGYRSCLRCVPQEHGVWQRDLQRVQRVCQILESRSSEGREVLLGRLATRAGISSAHLQKSFKHILGVSPRQYLDAVRVRRFKSMLRSGSKVGSAARSSGLGGSGTLYGRTDISGGIPYSTYQQGGVGLHISYVIVQCPLGLMLLAATDAGVCSILLGTEMEVLKTELHREFGEADIREDTGTMGPYVLAALSSFGMDQEASESAQRLPLEIRGSAFQWRVWQFLRSLPPGTTLSYSQIAVQIGQPKGARAVGTACATNRIALAIPCQRAVRADGHISGYRWGPKRKEALLRHEQTLAQPGLSDTDI